MASRALAVAIGYQIYKVTQDPLALGFLGLAEAIPAVGMALFGGHVADRYNRRSIVLWTRLVSLAAICFALISLNTTSVRGILLYIVVFVARIARGFADPATSAFEAPRANAICERFIGSLRRECLDHLLVIGERQLTRVLKEYVSYFNPARPHQGISQRIPASRVPPPGMPNTSRVIARSVLNGLHHDYRWAAT